jgi:hypothetical protein
MTGAGWHLAAFSQLALASGQPVFVDSRRLAARSRFPLRLDWGEGRGEVSNSICLQSTASRSREIASDSPATGIDSRGIADRLRQNRQSVFVFREGSRSIKTAAEFAECNSAIRQIKNLRNEPAASARRGHQRP